MKKFNSLSDTMKAAYITGIATIIAAIIGGIFLLKSINPTQPISSSVTPTPSPSSLSSLTPTPSPTVPAVTQTTPTYLMDIGVADGDTPGYGLAILNGTQYPHSLRYQFPTYFDSMSLTSTFNLGHRFRRFQATIGIEDQGVTCGVVSGQGPCKMEYELYHDNIRIYDKTVAYTATSFKVDLDIQNAGTLTLTMTSAGIFKYFEGTVAWGDAVVSNT